jgi:hypothetical protein
MKKFNFYQLLKYCCVLAIASITSCKNTRPPQWSSAEKYAVKDSVTIMAVNISTDVSAHGPSAWINYFENDPGFFMASGGTLVFEDYVTAVSYTRDTVAKNFKKISLGWKRIKVDPLTADYAAMGADFHEDIVLANGQNLSVEGYFTATAHFDGSRWKLRNMNWAIKPPEKPAN